MQRREFLKGLVSLPLLAAIPVTALFKPQTVQEIIDGWYDGTGQITQLTIWDKVLSAEEMAVYLDRQPAHPVQGPAFGSVRSFFCLPPVESLSVSKKPWINHIATTPTETVAAWIRKAA